MRPRKTLVAALAAVVVTAVVFGLSRTEIGQTFEHRTLDYRFRKRSLGSIAPELLVIAIDDKSLEVAGRWPWPRDYHVALLQAMATNKPAALGFDILFLEPDPANPDADRQLAQTAGELGIGEFGAVAKRVGNEYVLAPMPILQYAGSWGLINAERDPDGVLRRLPIWMQVGNRQMPSLVFQTVCSALRNIPSGGWDTGVITIHPAGVSKPPVTIPIDTQGRMLINYRQTAASFANSSNAVNFLTILKSYGQVSDGQKPDWDLSQLKDRIILVGLSATGLDVSPTPIDDNMPLVFAQANAINNILLQDFLWQFPAWPFWPLLAFGMFGLCLLTLSHGAPKSALYAIGIIVTYTMAVWIVFVRWSIWVEFFWPVVGMFLVFSSVTAYQFFTEEREKRFVKQAFQHYLSPNVMAEVLANPHKLVLGGVRRKMTVLFSDIRGFTLYSEKRPPEEVVPVLNELQDELSKAIFRHDGTLNKFMGDAIMAFWGAPAEPKPDDSLRAVRAAIEMVETLKRLETKWKAQGIEPFGIGIGINTGEMIVGNMGSTMHFDYTVIGDEVNLGARLESLTRQYDANIIVSEATYREVKENVRSKDLGEAIVKGRAKPVRIYTLDGMSNKT